MKRSAPGTQDGYALAVTRSRASAPVLAAALLALLALTAAACGSAAPTGGQTVASGSNGPSSSAEPTSAVSGSPSAQPTSGTSGNPSDTPGPSSGGGPSSSAAAPNASACSGTDNNRSFYAKFAQVVTWAVYCPVLAKGWFVSSGGYRLANGGKLEITYSGPGGASVAWSEGAFCASSDGCVPSGTDAGSATLGAMPGTVVALDDGGWAVVVARGSNPEWLLVAHGIDQPTTEALAAAMALVTP